jgi:hypothetical protein
MKIRAKVELIGLECVMIKDHPMVRATFAACEYSDMWISPDCTRYGDSHINLHFTEEQAEKLTLHSKFELELCDAN